MASLQEVFKSAQSLTVDDRLRLIALLVAEVSNA